MAIYSPGQEITIEKTLVITAHILKKSQKGETIPQNSLICCINVLQPAIYHLYRKTVTEINYLALRMPFLREF